MIRVGINGLGRIGRLLARRISERPDAGASLTLAAANEIADAETVAHLLKYDSTHGRFGLDVEVTDAGLQIDGKTVALTHRAAFDHKLWTSQSVELVIDCTGEEIDRAKASEHLGGSVERVLLSQPASADVDATVIWGLNEQILTRDMAIISAGSCTSNALMPILFILDRALGINAGIITTIHSAMNDQPVIDAYHHTDLRKTRAAFNSVIPVETGLAQGVERFLPHLAPKIQARALRVPTLNVSSLDVVLAVDTDTTAAAVNQVIREASPSFSGVLSVNDEPLASCDFLGMDASSVVDATQTQVSAGRLVKLMIWFDNEWAFANRMIDIAIAMSNFKDEKASGQHTITT